MSKNEKKGCSNCRYQLTGWDGGFFGLPFTCECRIYGETENRKDCKEFKRPFPKGFSLLVEFRKWFNNLNRTSDYMDQEFKIDYDDLVRFRREWE